MDTIDLHIQAIKDLDKRVTSVIVVRDPEDPSGKIEEFKRKRERESILGFIAWLSSRPSTQFWLREYKGADDLSYSPTDDTLSRLVNEYLGGGA